MEKNMNPKILIVEDEQAIADNIQYRSYRCWKKKPLT
jgi:hypothetical protein